MEMQFPELEYGIPVKYVHVANNNTIAYHEEGDGEIVLLFVHGLASYLKAWIKLIPLLSTQYRCIAIDLPGYGKSTGGVHVGSQEYYVSVLQDFCDAMNLQNVVCIGHSMGGQITVSTALAYPKLFRSIVLLATAGLEKFTTEEIEAIKDTHPGDGYYNADDNQIQASYEINFHSPPPDLDLMITDRKAMRDWKNFKQYSSVVNNSLFGLLAQSSLPNFSAVQVNCLLVFGENDKLIPHPYLHKNLEIHELVQSVIEQNSLISAAFVKNCGHFIPWEKPHETADLIKKYVESLF